MMEHRLKILPAYIKEIMAGRKSFEVRKDDREPPYRPGDTLLLEEFAEGCRYTGRWVRADVRYVLRGEYCKDGYCIMSITVTGWHGFAPPTNADRIRAMSDEELAVTLMCPNEMGMAEIPCDHSDGKNCCACLLDWLSKTAEED